MGGAERALERLLRCRPASGPDYDIRLFILDALADARPAPPGVTVQRLDARGRLGRSIVQLALAFRRWRPDLVVSLLVRSNLAAAAAAPAIGVPAILCERMHLRSHLRGNHRGIRLRIAEWLPRLLYRRATRVLAVSGGVADDLVANFGLAPDHVSVIPNGFDVPALKAEAAAPPPFPLPARFIVAVGRLVPAKGMTDLVDAYLRADPGLPLVILGDGPQRAELEQMLAQAGAEHRVLLPGFVANPLPIVGRAAFLMSASRNEGFPNAIGEAMALGVPVLATDCPSGPSELLGAAAEGAGRVTRAPHGLIVPMGDVAALARGIACLMDGDARDRLADAARDGIARFAADAVFGRYWAAFDAALRATDAPSSR